MNLFPTLAIFLVNFRKKQKKVGSLLDVKDNSSISCLAAVNYFQHGTHTQVLWLASTLEEPPPDSLNVQWRSHGLCTYLLCMLVKQHTGLSTSMNQSVLSLQGSHVQNSAAHSFYLNLGFISHDEFVDDNGLSQTSEGFQEQVKNIQNYG